MRWLLPLAAASLISSTACSPASRIRAETGLAQVLISDEDEVKLGRQVREELNKKNVKYLEDPQTVSYVQGVATRLFPHAEKDRPGVRWSISVIDDPKTVNAFATPGGFLYVYTGLLLAAENEAELAGVMGHEIGHVVGRHSARQLVNAYGLQAVLSLALGKNPGLAQQLAATLAAKGVLLAHGRSEETESDEMGARYSAAANYDPRGLMSFFGKLQAQQGGSAPAFVTWFSSHPDTADRIRHVGQYIEQHRLSGSDLGPDRLAAIKQRLKAR